MDASFSTGGGRSRTGIAMYLVNPIDGSESLVQWSAPPGGSQDEAARQSMSAQQEAQQGSTVEEDLNEERRLIQEKIYNLTQEMLDTIYDIEPRLAPGSHEVHRVIRHFAEYISQFGQLEEARPASSGAEQCFKNHIKHFTERASMGIEDDTDMVDAIVLANEIMPELLPAAFAKCVEQAERHALAQSIDQELRRVEIEKERQQAAEAQPQLTLQVTHCNAEDVTRLIINRMAELSQQWEVAEELISSLRSSLRPFFEETSGTDSEYLTRAAIAHVDRMRIIERDRIQRTELNSRASLSLIRHVGKIMKFLPDAITETLKRVQFNPEAPPLRNLPEDEAEYEEYDVDDGPVGDQPQGLPSAGTFPGTPLPMDPHELPMPISLIQRPQASTTSIQGPDPPNLPPNRWQGWKTQTGPTIADVEQSRRSPPVEHESEMPESAARCRVERGYGMISSRDMKHRISVEHQARVELYQLHLTKGLPQHKLECPILSLKEKAQSLLIDHQGSLLEEMLSNLHS